ncbi:hypothetical protein [Halosegnis longus]|uniref:hypothetical protein n=1 Tax=Halosegnis longus TaxID=2216012 RepID=UPI0011CDE6F6
MTLHRIAPFDNWIQNEVDPRAYSVEVSDEIKYTLFQRVIIGYYIYSDAEIKQPVPSDLLLVVNDEASHGTAPLGWDICWFTTGRHGRPMAGPRRRYSYPGMGLGVIMAETPQRFESVSRTFCVSESRYCAFDQAV